MSSRETNKTEPHGHGVQMIDVIRRGVPGITAQVKASLTYCAQLLHVYFSATVAQIRFLTEASILSPWNT